jgi:hypothetical protein
MKNINSHSRKDQIVINIPTNEFASAFFKLLAEKLKNSYVFHHNINGNLLTFKGSICRFVWNGWNVFNTISKGEIEFTEEEGFPFIRHRIFLTESLIIALLFHLIPIFALRYEPLLSLAIFLGIWILYTINYLVTIFRFNSYISDLLIKVNIENGYKFKTDIPAFG